MYVTAQHLISTGRTPGSVLMEKYARNKMILNDLPWLNLGYWSDGSTYQIACENMSEKLAQLADLENCLRVLDAGSGFCAPAIHWARKHSNLTIFAGQHLLRSN